MPADVLVWGRPLPPGPSRDRWIACAISMCEDASGGYLTAHYVFARWVLGEARDAALSIAVRFQLAPLTDPVEMGALADEWWEPTSATEETSR